MDDDETEVKANLMLNKLKGAFMNKLQKQVTIAS